MHTITSIKKRLRKLTTRGFTLIEILIAVGIFAIVAVLSVSSFLALSSMQKNKQVVQEILNEFRFTIDLIGKEINYGDAFPDTCEKGCSNIVFGSKVRPDVERLRIIYISELYPSDTDDVLNVLGCEVPVTKCATCCNEAKFTILPALRAMYPADPVTGDIKFILKGQQKSYGECYEIPLKAGCYQPITSDKVAIDYMQFFVNNTADGEHPIVSMSTRGKILPGTKYEQLFDLSDSYSPRSSQDPLALPPVDNVKPTIGITEKIWANPYLTLRGWTNDNIPDNILEVKWTNTTTGQTGYSFSRSGGSGYYSTWESDRIRLRMGGNTIEVEATDRWNNVSDTITINHTRPSVAPPSTSVSLSGHCPSSGNGYIRVRHNYSGWDQLFNIDRIRYYSCLDSTPGDGVPCTPSNWTTKSPYNLKRGFFKDFEVHASDDGSAWSLISFGSFPPESQSEYVSYFDAVDKRYVRFLGLSEHQYSTHDKYTNIGELTVVGLDGFALDKSLWDWEDTTFPTPITADDNCPTDVDEAFDDNEYSAWDTYSCNPDSNMPHWIDVDLGSSQTFNNVRYKHDQDSFSSWDGGASYYGTEGSTYCFRLRGENNNGGNSSLSGINCLVVPLCDPSGNGNSGDSSSGAFSLKVTGKNPIEVGVNGKPSDTSLSPTSDVTTIKVVPSGGFSGDVALSASGGPSGTKRYFSKTTVAPNGSTSFWVRVPNNSAQKTYTLIVYGKEVSGSENAKATVGLIVSSSEGGDN